MQTLALAVLALAGVAAATSVVPPPYSQTCQINVPQPYNAAYACPSKCQMSCNVYQYSAAQGSYVNKLSPTAANCGGVLMYNIEYYNFYNQLETGWVAAAYLDCSMPPPALMSANGDVQQPSANSGQEPQVAPQPEQQRRREASTTSRRTPQPYQPQLCQINVPYPYNSVYACPNQCETSCNIYQYTAAQGSSVLKLNPSPVYCGGVPYYYIQYYNFYNQLQQGYVAAVYLDCSTPPPALMSANGDVEPSANSGQEPQVAPQPEQQRRRDAEGTANTVANESQQKQCKVPKTTHTYNLITCEPQVQINGGSVVVDMGGDVVYSSTCGQTYLYVEYMLWGGEIGYGYVPYNALQC